MAGSLTCSFSLHVEDTCVAAVEANLRKSHVADGVIEEPTPFSSEDNFSRHGAAHVQTQLANFKNRIPASPCT